jgi:hypothetical protein
MMVDTGGHTGGVCEPGIRIAWCVQLQLQDPHQALALLLWRDSAARRRR